MSIEREKEWEVGLELTRKVASISPREARGDP